MKLGRRIGEGFQKIKTDLYYRTSTSKTWPEQRVKGRDRCIRLYNQRNIIHEMWEW